MNRALILAFLAIFLAYSTGVISWLFLDDADQAKDFAGIVQSWATVAAFMVAGIFAVLRLEIFREFSPHVTITQTVSHRSISDRYVHIFVTATLHNSSKVRVDIRRGFFRLQAISPISDEAVEALYADVYVNRVNRDFQWQTIDEAPREWSRNDLIVEPGESHQETCEFIVTSEMRTVLVDTYMYNSRSPAVPVGWGTTSAYDILERNI